MKGIENSYKSMVDYSKSVTIKNNSNSIINFLKQNNIHEKSDLFSLGAILTDLAYYYCIPHTEDNHEIVDLFNKLVSEMTELNVLKRCTIDEAINLVILIKNTQVSSFYFKNEKKIEKDINIYFSTTKSQYNSFKSPNIKYSSKYKRSSY